MRVKMVYAVRTMAKRAFTVGYMRSYDASLLGNKPTCKIGRRPDYDGGWVWRTEAEARAFLTSVPFALAFPGRDPSTFGVYQLNLPASWEIDVSATPDPRDGVHRLVNDAHVVARV